MQGSIFTALPHQLWANPYTNLLFGVLLIFIVLLLLFHFWSGRINPATSHLAHGGILMISLGLFLESGHHVASASSDTKSPDLPSAEVIDQIAEKDLDNFVITHKRLPTLALNASQNINHSPPNR